MQNQVSDNMSRQMDKAQILPVHELLEGSTVGETGTSHFQVVEKTEVHDLFE